MPMIQRPFIICFSLTLLSIFIYGAGSSLALASSFADANWSGEFGRPGIPFPGEITCTAEFNGDLIVAGYFEIPVNPPIRSIARWDGHAWQPLGTGLGASTDDAEVRDLVVFDGELLAAGRFGSAGGQAVNGLARWDGERWSGFDDGPRNGYISDLAIYAGRLLVAGEFESGSGQAAVQLMTWDGHAWSTISNCPFLDVWQAVAFRGGLVVAGSPPADHTNLACWNGATWTLLPFQENVVDRMIVYDDNLVVGGSFLRKNGAVADLIAEWDGTTWRQFGRPLSVGTDRERSWGINQVATLDGQLFAGGSFILDGSIENLLRWDGRDWKSLMPSGPGFEVSDTNCAAIRTLGSHDGDLVAAGCLVLLDNIRVGGLARWDGVSWHAYGGGSGIYPSDLLHLTNWNSSLVIGATGVQGPLMLQGNELSPMATTDRYLRPFMDILVHDGELLATNWYGYRLLRWTGESWSPADSGFFAYDLDYFDGSLVATGFFRSDPDGSSSVARWNGTDWSRVGPLIEGETYKLAVYRGQLVASVGIKPPGASSTSGVRIVRWNGDTWETIGACDADWSALVDDFAVFGDDLIATGRFPQMNGVPAPNIARWDGNEWHPLGSGLTSSNQSSVRVRTLKVFGDRLAAGGVFTTAGGEPAANLAFWDGATWTAIGSGTNGEVSDLETIGNDLYVAGDFTMAGGKPSYGIARWTSEPGGFQPSPEPPISMLPPYPNPSSAVTRLDYSTSGRGRSQISVFDVQGRKVIDLLDRIQPAGPHSITWDGRDGKGTLVPPGVYYVRISLDGGRHATRKLIRMR